MAVPYDPGLADAFLALHFAYRPVDATFMGDNQHDHRLPPAKAGTEAEEVAALAALKARLEETQEPEDLGERLDCRLMLSEIAIREQASQRWSRFDNPAWFTGEAAFAIVSLLLPQSAPVREDALLARMQAIAEFLKDGSDCLHGKAVPQAWSARAIRECRAMASFLREDIRLHEAFADRWTEPAAGAADAFDAFAQALGSHPDRPAQCGETYMAELMQTLHGLDLSPRQAIAVAEDAFQQLGRELEEMAAAIDPSRTAEELIGELLHNRPGSAEEAFESYRHWDTKAREMGRTLVTPAEDYGLDYRLQAPCFRRLAGSLYFLFYRSPPGLNPGAGSVYWVSPPGDDEKAYLAANATAVVKTVHSVHHGSIGHHTQNTRARAAASRLARIAGTDCALGLAFLGSGTLIEGWACYGVDLLAEADGFYTPQERLLLKQSERRNAASVLVDIKLHLGDWTMDQAAAFYRDEAGFAPARVQNEVVRNSMLPGSRLMYWLGVEGIKALRARWLGETRDFHDTLLSYGHLPLAWIGEEMQRAGLLRT